MTANASTVALVCALGSGLLLWPLTAPAGDARRGASPFVAVQGQEVVNGSYSCDGTVFTDDQPASISAGSYLSATSGITSGLFGTSQRSVAVAADLEAMARICDAHVAQVVSQVPPICTLGPIARERGAFGNGSTTVVRFDFSCQGTRDEVVGVIGGMSRLTLTARVP
jgi:hypothetical protein